MAQLGCLDGAAARVQEYLGSLAEALTDKVTRAACDARAVGKELPAGRLARIIFEQLNLQRVRITFGFADNSSA